ncbi:MAG: hypothetical protein GSR80_000240 [Desulfurococcales archaeon]|nr:hypothetical protein [Desulfurococcales archaeon]
MILELLKALRSVGMASPGDMVAVTGMPRYLVLSAFKFMEELGLVDVVYSKGSHRIYRISVLGERLLNIGFSDLSLIIEKGLNAVEAHSKEDDAIVTQEVVGTGGQAEAVPAES